MHSVISCTGAIRCINITFECIVENMENKCGENNTLY